MWSMHALPAPSSQRPCTTHQLLMELLTKVHLRLQRHVQQGMRNVMLLTCNAGRQDGRQEGRWGGRKANHQALHHVALCDSPGCAPGCTAPPLVHQGTTSSPTCTSRHASEVLMCRDHALVGAWCVYAASEHERHCKGHVQAPTLACLCPVLPKPCDPTHMKRSGWMRRGSPNLSSNTPLSSCTSSGAKLSTAEGRWAGRSKQVGQPKRAVV